jgi:dissimilatory sulfite reductase (desulfoviridin) alpha/beta subunit
MSQLFRLKNGTVLLSTEAPGGIYNSGQLKKIAELCSKELAIVKATEDQRLALFVKESEVENVAKQLRAMGLGFRHYQDNLHQPVSCLGELCEEHEQPAMATAMDITKEIASIQLNAPLKIGINGCARCCTPCHTLDIAVVGDVSGYRISLGGKTRQMPEFASYFAEGVPPKELPKRLKAVIETFKNLAEDGETLHDVIERCGVTDFVQALAPYSQDAAHRDDPFAQEAVAAESTTDLDVPADDLNALESMEAGSEDLELDLAAPEDDLLASDEDALSADPLSDSDVTMDTDLAADDDLRVADDGLDDLTLEEIPIEQGDQGSLEDDLSLGSDDASLPLGDVSLNEDSVEEISEDSIEEISEDSIEEISEDGIEEISEDSLLDEASMQSSATAELNDSISLESDDFNLDDDALNLDTAAAITEDDIDLDAPELDIQDDALEALPDESDLGMDESLTLEDDLSMDMPEEIDDAALTAAENPVDEDLEGIPELDEDLALDGLPAPVPAAKAPAAPAPAPAPVPAASLQDEFGEELPGDVPELSDEEESQFEQKLQASIDEESRLIAKADKDPNIGAREAALSLLENSEELDDQLDAIELDDAVLDETMTADDELEVIGRDEDLESISADTSLDDEQDMIAGDEDLAVADDAEQVDEVLEPIQESMEEFPEPGPSELAHIKSRQLGQKLQGSTARQQFKLSAITFQDDHMRVTFESGAYVDFDLSALGLGEERNFRLGLQSVSVISTSEGYILEVDGMRLFHPKTSLPAAS